MFLHGLAGRRPKERKVVLDAGALALSKDRSTEKTAHDAGFGLVWDLDGRPAFMVVEGQEVLTSDGVAVKVSLAARYVVGDPVAAVTNEQDFRRAIHLELQLGLRDAVAAGTLEEVLAARSKIGPAVMERTASPAGTACRTLIAAAFGEAHHEPRCSRLWAMDSGPIEFGCVHLLRVHLR